MLLSEQYKPIEELRSSGNSMLLASILVVMSSNFFLVSFVNAQNPAIPVQKVIVFGIDGLNTYRFDEAYTPNIEYMQRNGSWTFKAQANDPLSSSPNWKGIVTGTTPEVHRVLENGFKRSVYRDNPSCEGEPDKFPTIFTMIKRHNPKWKTGLFEHWGAFYRLIKGDKKDAYYWWKFGMKPNVNHAMKFFSKKNPALTFIHLDECDHAGHAHGHESVEYLHAVEEVDQMLGKVIRTIMDGDGFENTTLIVVADHGGKGSSHGSRTPEGMTVPFLIMGPGIRKGHEIQQEVKNEDTAFMVLRALDIEPHKCWTAKLITEVYEPF